MRNEALTTSEGSSLSESRGSNGKGGRVCRIGVETGMNIYIVENGIIVKKTDVVQGVVFI